MTLASHPPADPGSRPAGGAPLAYGVAGVLLLVPAAAELLSVIGFAAGRPIGASHLALALGVAAAATLALGALDGAPLRRTCAALGLGAAVLGVSALVAASCWDFSYDGQAYHQSAISLLARGWNPLAGPLTPEDTVHRLWIEHYLRGPELGAAVTYAATGSLEVGKAFGFGLLAATALLVATALRRAGASPLLAMAGGTLAAANPIALSQLATFYVDGQLALLFTCAVALAFLALRTPLRSAWPLLATALGLLAQVKFTGIVYAVLLLLGMAVVACRAARPPGAPWRVLALGVAVGAATLLVGSQPLLTNTRDHRHPFFPLAGAGAVDIVSGQAPRFPARGTLARFVVSTFSESSAGREAPVPKWPFVVRPRELDAMAEADVRVAGFGPLFALALVLCALGAGYHEVARRRRPSPASSGLLVAAWVLATAAVNPAAWWARYVPQVWLATLIAAVALSASVRGPARWLGVAALVVLGADAALVGASVAQRQVETQAAAVAQLHDLARAGPEVVMERGDMESLQARLETAGLRASYRARCERAMPLVGASTWTCR